MHTPHAPNKKVVEALKDLQEALEERAHDDISALSYDLQDFGDRLDNFDRMSDDLADTASEVEDLSEDFRNLNCGFDESQDYLSKFEEEIKERVDSMEDGMHELVSQAISVYLTEVFGLENEITKMVSEYLDGMDFSSYVDSAVKDSFLAPLEVGGQPERILTEMRIQLSASIKHIDLLLK